MPVKIKTAVTIPALETYPGGGGGAPGAASSNLLLMTGDGILLVNGPGVILKVQQ